MTDLEKIIPEQHDDPSQENALDSFLSREPADRDNKPARRHRRVPILIAAAVLIAALVALLLYLRSLPLSPSDEEDAVAAEVSAAVDEQGEHQVVIPTDAQGEIKANGAGSLLSYVPADIERIDVENTDGSFTILATTPADSSTSYTLVGYERYELQGGMADTVANSACSLDFTRIVAADGNPADFGLDQPRATVHINYTDGSSSTVRVGAAAPAAQGVYVAFGDSNAVYLVDDEAVEGFLYSVLDLISLTVTESAPDTDSGTFNRLTITGARYPEAIVLQPNTDAAINAPYLVTSPRRMFANTTESYDIAGAIRDLYAESVVCVNPSDGQLRSYGLLEPYAAIRAEYPDVTIQLSASAADADGAVYLYNPDTDVIYTIQLGAVSWANTSPDALIPEVFLDVDLRAVSRLTFTAGSASYEIEVNTTTEEVENTDGDTEEVTSTTATYQGERLSTENFSVFFQNLTGIKYQGAPADAGQRVMQVSLRYTTGREPDTLTVYDTGTSHYTVALNGELVGLASKSYVDKLIAGADDLFNGQTVHGI